MSNFQPHYIKIAIEIYGLELGGHQVDTILETWLKQYDPAWILKAIVESLYRGRYKIVSVENILKDWQRLGSPRYQFTPEYERDIVAKIPVLPTPAVSPISSLASDPAVGVDVVVPVISSMPAESIGATQIPLQCQLPPMSPVPIDSDYLNPEESAPFQSHYHSLASPYSYTPVGSSEASEDLNLEPNEPDWMSEDASSEQREPTRSLPTVNPLHRKGRFQNCHDRFKLERIISQPVSRKLFNTLKAIVDPNHQERAEVCASASLPPLAIGNSQINNIANFAISIDPPSEERQV
jgi:hypothetical protein